MRWRAQGERWLILSSLISLPLLLFFLLLITTIPMWEGSIDHQDRSGSPFDDREIVGNVEVRHEVEEGETFVGYVITTTHQTIKVLISQEQDCCESLGVSLHCPLNADHITLVGATVRSVVWSTSRRGKDEFDERHSVWVVIYTDCGPFKVEAYKTHNGCNPHTVRKYWMDHEDTHIL